MAKTKREMDKETMFNKIMPSFAEHLPPEAQPGARETSLQDDQSALFVQGGGLAEPNTVMAYNISERLVLKIMDGVLSRFNCCHCDRCRRDVAAYALGLLPPKYIVADLTKVEAAETDYPRQQVVDALVKACLRVRGNPRH